MRAESAIAQFWAKKRWPLCPFEENTKQTQKVLL